ncbi:MAG: trypsin-like peptidase domain-containing protein [Clostridia bacterium]|jgi:S1-C subfamily serine protease|nr:trypsin-like peptidase domain-containing protein [Clostridia bacterium]
MEEKYDYEKTQYEDEEPDGDEEILPVRHSVWIRLIALITVVVFVGMIAAPLWKTFKARVPSSELLEDSLLLKEQIDRELLEAIVKIKVTPQELGSGGTAGQKNGTGFNVNSDGVIITNHHVIAGARSITVTFPDGKTYKAKSWAGMPEYDLAVIELERDSLAVVSLNPDMLPQPGDTLTVIGNPMDFNQLAVEGRLKDYVFVKDMPTAMLYIDVPIYPGNSGSPVFNNDGEVVAVVFGSLRRIEEGKEKFYGLAIPIKEVLVLLEDSLQP